MLRQQTEWHCDWQELSMLEIHYTSTYKGYTSRRTDRHTQADMAVFQMRLGTCISCVKPSKSTVTPCALASSCVISNGKPYVSYSTNASRPLTLGLLPFAPFVCLAAAYAQYTMLLIQNDRCINGKAAVLGHSVQNDKAKVQLRDHTTSEP